MWQPVLALLPKADAGVRGASVFRTCRTCHTAEKGGKDLVGPRPVGRRRPQGRVGRPSFGVALFRRHEVAWGRVGLFEHLAKYLHKPAEEIPGNKMVFAGVANDADLADVLAYLRTQSDSPVALPKWGGAKPGDCRTSPAALLKVNAARRSAGKKTTDSASLTHFLLGQG